MKESIGEKVFGITITLVGWGVGFLFFIYFPASLVYNIYDRIKNPPSEIYGERQVLDEWKLKCSDEDCYEKYYRLKTKAEFISQIGKENETVSEVLVKIEADEYFEEWLTLELRDWESGEELQTFPQQKHKWYQIFKSYDTYESVLFLIDEDGNSLGFEAQFTKDYILVDEESCDSRGLESQQDVQGGCFLLEKFSNNEEFYHTLQFELKNGHTIRVFL